MRLIVGEPVYHTGRLVENVYPLGGVPVTLVLRGLEDGVPCEHDPAGFGDVFEAEWTRMQARMPEDYK